MPNPKKPVRPSLTLRQVAKWAAFYRNRRQNEELRGCPNYTMGVGNSGTQYGFSTLPAFGSITPLDIEGLGIDRVITDTSEPDSVIVTMTGNGQVPNTPFLEFRLNFVQAFCAWSSSRNEYIGYNGVISQGIISQLGAQKHICITPIANAVKNVVYGADNVVYGTDNVVHPA